MIILRRNKKANARGEETLMIRAFSGLTDGSLYSYEQVHYRSIQDSLHVLSTTYRAIRVR